MKAKIRVLSLVSILAGSLSGIAQTNSPTEPGAAGGTLPTNSASPVVATNAAEVTQTNVTEVAALATSEAAVAAAADLGTNAPAEPGAIIPLIMMEDAKLTDAISNLARQAGINYMLDPRIGFTQPGPDGKPVPQPSVSLRWEKITAEQALTALLNNYNLQLVPDPKTHIARVTVKDPTAPEPLITKVIQLQYASPTNIVEAINDTFRGSRNKAIADNRTSQVLLMATEKDMAAAEELIRRFDTQTKQVLIEAQLVETSMNPSSVKGLDWSGTLEAQRLSAGNNLQTLPVDQKYSANAPLASLYPKVMLDTAKGFNPSTAFLDADGLSAVLSFLNKYSESKVLSTPRAVTLDNESATLSVTRAVPIFEGSVSAMAATAIQSTKPDYTNVGVILHVTPRISANNFVNLKVIPEVSRVADTVTKLIGGQPNQADVYDIRKVETRVMIPSGNTLVLGGLVQDDIRKSNTKVPLLGDIPVLGAAFRSDSKSRQKSNLLIFITPTIVQDSDYQPANTTFLKTKRPTKDYIEEDWSAWDSGKPAERKKAAKAGEDNTPALGNGSAPAENRSAPKGPQGDGKFADFSNLMQPVSATSTTATSTTATP